jgi:intraflagellar transport protein 46
VVPKENMIMNQPVDEKVSISQDDDEHVPSPHDSQANTEYGGAGMKEFGGGEVMVGGYNPADYQNLDISPEVKNLFKLITEYQPEVVEIETELKPFKPDYIPAVGEVDAFLKMPRPDQESEFLGIQQLDEPALNQSKRAYLDLMLVQKGKVDRKDYKEVHSIENAHKNQKEIQTWISGVDKIQDVKTGANVIYSKPMPDMDTLMEAWDPEFERALSEMKLPRPDLDIDTKDYAKFALTMLDIPIYPSNKDRNLIEGLHVMFSLYQAYQSNQHFNQDDQGGQNVQRLEM